MKDFLGRELNVGDEVIYLEHFRTSSHFNRGIVMGFTPMKINIDNYSSDGRQMWRDQKFPHHVVKVGWTNVKD